MAGLRTLVFVRWDLLLGIATTGRRCRDAERVGGRDEACLRADAGGDGVGKAVIIIKIILSTKSDQAS